MSDTNTNPKKNQGTPVRLTEEALRWARIASGYTGESASAYCSRVVLEHARADADRLHEEAKRGGAAGPPADPGPKPKRRG